MFRVQRGWGSSGSLGIGKLGGCEGKEVGKTKAKNFGLGKLEGQESRASGQKSGGHGMEV